MTSPRIIRHLLLATALAWGLSASMGRASVNDKDFPEKVAELHGITADERVEPLQRNDEEIPDAKPLQQEEKHQWLKALWAALSPDQRGQLRNQIRDHWQRMPPEQRQQLREERRMESRPDPAFDGAGRQDESRQQRLSPDQRLEFRQWMRDRRENGQDNNSGQGSRGGPR